MRKGRGGKGAGAASVRELILTHWGESCNPVENFGVPTLLSFLLSAPSGVGANDEELRRGHSGGRLQWRRGGDPAPAGPSGSLGPGGGPPARVRRQGGGGDHGDVRDVP